MWTSQETVQLGIWVQFLAHIENTHDNIVTTGGLSSTKNATELIKKPGQYMIFVKKVRIKMKNDCVILDDR